MAHHVLQMAWHVTPHQGLTTFFVLHERDDEGGLWSGEVEIFRGAPSVNDHPEILHGIMRIGNLALFGEFIRHTWTYHVPDTWGGRSNTGAARQFFELRASNGPCCWTLILKLPLGAPQFVWKRIAQAFKAKRQKDPSETERLNSIPGMAKSIIEAAAEPVEEGVIFTGELP